MGARATTAQTGGSHGHRCRREDSSEGIPTGRELCYSAKSKGKLV